MEPKWVALPRFNQPAAKEIWAIAKWGKGQKRGGNADVLLHSLPLPAISFVSFPHISFPTLFLCLHELILLLCLLYRRELWSGVCVSAFVYLCTHAYGFFSGCAFPLVVLCVHVCAFSVSVNLLTALQACGGVWNGTSAQTHHWHSV